MDKTCLKDISQEFIIDPDEVWDVTVGRSVNFSCYQPRPIFSLDKLVEVLGELSSIYNLS